MEVKVKRNEEGKKVKRRTSKRSGTSVTKPHEHGMNGEGGDLDCVRGGGAD